MMYFTSLNNKLKINEQFKNDDLWIRTLIN